jgi:hypothetical protein
MAWGVGGRSENVLEGCEREGFAYPTDGGRNLGGRGDFVFTVELGYTLVVGAYGKPSAGCMARRQKSDVPA